MGLTIWTFSEDAATITSLRVSLIMYAKEAYTVSRLHECQRTAKDEVNMIYSDSIEHVIF